MIPLTLQPYAAVIRLGLCLAVVGVIFAAGWKAGSGAASQRLLRAQEKANAEYQSAIARAREAERAAYAKSVEASREYQSNLSALDASYRDALRRIGPVRVQRQPACAAGLPAVAAGTGRPDGAGTDAELPATAGGDSRDIGPDLVDLALDADRCRLKLAGLQAWVTATTN